MEATTIIGGLAGVKNAMDITKFLFEQSGNLDKALLKAKIVELSEQLSKVKMDMIEVQDENVDLKLRLKVNAELVYVKPFYFSKDESDKEPYCAQCKDNEGKAIHLHEYSKSYWECQTCDSKYRDPKAEENPPIRFLTVGPRSNFTRDW